MAASNVLLTSVQTSDIVVLLSQALYSPPLCNHTTRLLLLKNTELPSVRVRSTLVPIGVAANSDIASSARRRNSEAARCPWSKLVHDGRAGEQLAP